MLPKGFFNKDGGKVLRVDSTSLQKRYKDLWYTLPCNIKQNLSNSFILTMCQMMEPKFKTLRELSDWARKERKKRIELLFAVHPVDEKLGEESKFIQSKSLKWQLHQLKKRYPVSAKADMFLKNETILSHVNAESLTDYLKQYQGIMMKLDAFQAACNSSIVKSSSENIAKEYHSEMLSFYKDMKKQIENFKHECTTDLEKFEGVLSNYKKNATLSTVQDKTKLIKEKANKRKQKRVDNIREAKRQRELNSDIKDKADENKGELHVQDEHIEEQPKSDPESNLQSDNEEKVDQGTEDDTKSVYSFYSSSEEEANSECSFVLSVDGDQSPHEYF